MMLGIKHITNFEIIMLSQLFMEQSYHRKACCELWMVMFSHTYTESCNMDMVYLYKVHCVYSIHSSLEVGCPHTFR